VTTPEIQPTPQRRTVLLAQPGAARDRLRDALQQAGAEVVLIADPCGIALDAVTVVEPDSVLVALDPAIEMHLERFGAVLGDPSITVIFDEADLAARREGWDAARWSRHLRAKLYGHDDVLPPGQTEPDDSYPEPGMPITPQQRHAHASFGDFAGEAEAHVAALPTDALGDGLLAGLDQVEGELPGLDADNADTIDYRSFDLGDDHDEGEGEGADATPTQEVGLDEYLLATVDPQETAAIPAAAKARTISSGEWSLDEDGATYARPPAPPATIDIEELERRIAGLSLADTDSYGHGPQRGAVVLFAGLGGPDAVRQLLKALPEGFPRPVLIRQRLDGGQYDKLVGQLARAATLPVQLALADAVLEAGNIYVMPPTLGLARNGADLVFSASAALFDALPASDSAVVMLSGGDIAMVDPVMRLAAAGAWVAGQAPEGCFEPAAAKDLVARGGETGLPTQLAERLAERWPA
jgi:chemosensory pili system protein ChpB (putative protein-glutamate methylesterase)